MVHTVIFYETDVTIDGCVIDIGIAEGSDILSVLYAQVTNYVGSQRVFVRMTVFVGFRCVADWLHGTFGVHIADTVEIMQQHEQSMEFSSVRSWLSQSVLLN